MEKKIYTPGVIHRLSMYLRYLSQLDDVGRITVSSNEMSNAVNVNSAEIRRDLLTFKASGKRGVGYDVKALINIFNEIIGTHEQTNIILVGAGNLGAAIVNFDALKKHGFMISGVFDKDSRKIGREIGDKIVQPMNRIKDVVMDNNVKTAIIAVPPSAVQGAAEEVAKAGIKVILNYTSARIEPMPGVIIQTTDPVEKLLHTLYYLTKTGSA